jgi:hypothetical protein
MDILTSFFKNLLANNFSPVWRFDLSNLYPPTSPNLNYLDDPFTISKITDAIFSLRYTASSGPDGFGPGFFTKFWNLTKMDIFALFEQFFSLTADIKGINRAYMVLLPKSRNAHFAESFRPISLQNGPIKAISKVLTKRLQQTIHSLVDNNQTGFLLGRSISGNFCLCRRPTELLPPIQSTYHHGKIGLQKSL